MNLNQTRKLKKKSKISNILFEIDSLLPFFQTNNFVFEFEKDQYFDINRTSSKFRKPILLNEFNPNSTNHPIFLPNNDSIFSSFQIYQFNDFDPFSLQIIRNNYSFVRIYPKNIPNVKNAWIFFMEKSCQVYFVETDSIFNLPSPLELPLNLKSIDISINGEKELFSLYCRDSDKNKQRELLQTINESDRSYEKFANGLSHYDYRTAKFKSRKEHDLFIQGPQLVVDMDFLLDLLDAQAEVLALCFKNSYNSKAECFAALQKIYYNGLDVFQ